MNFIYIHKNYKTNLQWRTNFVLADREGLIDVSPNEIIFKTNRRGFLIIIKDSRFYLSAIAKSKSKSIPSKLESHL